MKGSSDQNIPDFKALSLALYNKKVFLSLSPESELFKSHGQHIAGILMERIWGEVFDGKDQKKDGITAVIIKTDQEELLISCKDIVEIYPDCVFIDQKLN